MKYLTDFSQLLEVILFSKMYKPYHKPLLLRTILSNFLLQIVSTFIMYVPNFLNEKSKLKSK